jgi:hypothetical protein
MSTVSIDFVGISALKSPTGPVAIIEVHVGNIAKVILGDPGDVLSAVSRSPEVRPRRVNRWVWCGPSTTHLTP